MKSIEERMTSLLAPELDEAVLTEQMLTEAVSAVDAILESNGLELKAEDLDSYIVGLQDILENYELAEADRAELQEIWRALVRGAGHVARGIGKTVGTFKKVKAAVGRAAGHIAGSYGAGHEAGIHSKAGPDEFEAPPKKAKAVKAAEPKKPGFFARAAAAGAEKERAKRAAQTPADKHIAATGAALAAKQAAAKEPEVAKKPEAAAEPTVKVSAKGGSGAESYRKKKAAAAASVGA